MKLIYLILAFLIIIIVAASWFSPVHCQEIDKEDLLREYRERMGKGNIGPDTSYRTAEIYGKQPKYQMPGSDSLHYVDSLADSNIKITEDTASVLEPFGFDLFGAPSELSPPSEVANIDDYLLGPGDNIIIYLWGRVEKEFNLTVDRQGKIFIPRIGDIVVWGMNLKKLEEKLKAELSKAYTDFELSISLGKIRSIRIYMTGEVNKPGAYTVSSLTTLFNALYLAGGPNQRGSMRNIRLVRNNRVETELDLYQFLLKGDSKSDVRMESGDAVFIPVTGDRVAVSGEVKRPAIYELTGSEKVSQLLELAGGPTAEAYLERILLDRISPDGERQIIDVNLSEGYTDSDDLVLKDGDSLHVFSIYDVHRNVVSVAGMVKHPGQFERTDTTTLKTILDRAELMPENVYMERANLFRRYADRRMEIIPIDLNKVFSAGLDLNLRDLDSLHVYSIDSLKRKRYVYIDGEVKNPGLYDYYENMTVVDLVFLAGNLNRNAYQLNVEVARTDSVGKVSLIKVDLTSEAGRRMPLYEDDRIFVREIPDWFLHRMVTIEGEVRFPGKYALVSRHETLYDLIERAGGFTVDAFPTGTIFQRKTIGTSLKRQNLPEIISNSQPLVEDSLGNIRKMDMLKFSAEKMNRVIIDMENIIYSGGREGNITLQDGDYIYVPEIPSGVSVMGAVGANGTIKFTYGEKVKYYIHRAGNFTNQADKKGTRLIKADGRVYSGGSTLGKKVELGDAIVVPTEIKRKSNWLETLSTAVSIIGGIATSALIIDRL